MANEPNAQEDPKKLVEDAKAVLAHVNSLHSVIRIGTKYKIADIIARLIRAVEGQ